MQDETKKPIKAGPRVPKKIVFGFPIIVGGKELTEVTMRVPKGKDLIAISGVKDPVIRDFTLISNLCNLNATLEEMQEMDAGELMLLQGAVKVFLSSTPKTSSKQQQKLGTGSTLLGANNYRLN
jgi:hypothetical protein